MNEKSRPENQGKDPATEQSQDALSPEVLVTFNRGLEVLKEAPWVGLGAACTAIGAAILYFYFQSIEYLPSDISSVLAASAAVAALALAFVVLMAMSLIAPRWGYQSSGLSTRSKSAAPSERLWGMDLLLVALQLIGPGIFLLFSAYGSWASCKDGWPHIAAPGAVLCAVGVISWILAEYREGASHVGRAKRVGCSLWIIFVSVLPFVALFVVLIPGQNAAWWDLFLLVLIWAFILGLNALFTRDQPVWVLAFVAAMLLPALLLSAPFVLGRPSLFPVKVAELAGIRDRLPGELRVPKDTCALIQSAFGAGQTSANLKCDLPGEWGAVHAQVLSNQGDRWLIEIVVDAGGQVGGGGKLRITIPGDGVQRVRRIALPAESCRAGGEAHK